MAEISGINHDTTAKLLGITPFELSNFVKNGVITRSDKDVYILPVVVRDYICYLKNPSKIWTQEQLSIHLDMSERNFRDVQTALSINCKTNTVDEIRFAYIRHLREQAAGRATNGELNLADERAKLAQQQTIRIEMQNAVTQREYGPIAALEQGLSDAMARAASQLDTIPGKLKMSSDKLTSADLNLVSSVIAEVRNSLADLEIDWFGDKHQTENDNLDDNEN